MGGVSVWNVFFNDPTSSCSGVCPDSSFLPELPFRPAIFSGFEVLANTLSGSMRTAFVIPLPLVMFTLFGFFSLRAETAGLDLTKLPVPPGAKRIHADAYSAIYSLEAPADETTGACVKLLMAQGWEPYGSAGITRYFKRGTTRLLATIQPEGGGTGRSMISYSSEAMSADIPLPPDTEEVQYNDSDKRLGFLSTLTPEGVTDFYRKSLAPAGWSTTMEKPEKDELTDVIIFRTQKGEMIRIEMKPAPEQKLLTTVTYNTAEEVAAEKQRVAAGMAKLREKIAKEAAAPKPKVKISLPAGTISKALIQQTLKLNLPAGKAKPAIESLCKELVASGWKETNKSLDAVAGTVNLSREDQTINMVYMDPGFMPAEVTITPQGFEIELAGSAAGE